MPIYRHTQKAYYQYVLLVVIAVVLAGIVTSSGASFHALHLFAFFILGVVCWLFSSLTVEVDDAKLQWHFGPGFWKKSIARNDIASATPVRTKWWYGYGIRYTPKGWLYNIQGLDAVAITQTSGKTVMIGTDEPQQLARALS